MTTIAYRDGVLAADSRVTSNDVVISDKHKKVWRLRDGSLFGWAGSVEESELMLLYLKGKAKQMPQVSNLLGLLIEPDGTIRHFEGRAWVKQRRMPYLAIGSGDTIALAAMDAGADAVRAVKIAIKRDTNSGGRAHHVRLKKGKHAR